MTKRIISFLLILSMIMSNCVTVFAGNTTNSYIQADDSKIISYVGENKLVLWETGDTVYAEQYDLKGNLIVSGRANRKTGEIIMTDNAAISRISAKDIVDTISTAPLPSLYAFKRVGTFPVYDRISLDRKSMYLYEDTGSAIRTTYSIRSYSGTVAALALGIATGMAVPGAIASKLVASLISSGLAVLVGDTLNISTKTTLAADKYELKYYGQDSASGAKSKTYNQTNKYIITDQESSKINEVYYDGSSYYDPNDDTPTLKLMQYIVPNLYGSNYEWDRW